MPEASKPTRSAVLLIEDEPQVLETTRQLLEMEFQVDTAASVEEASKLVGARRYDVIICDHMLPGEQGLEYLVRLSTEQPKSARILLTGYMNPELISRSVVVAGLSACLIKPVRIDDLMKAVRDAVKPKT